MGGGWRKRSRFDRKTEKSRRMLIALIAPECFVYVFCINLPSSSPLPTGVPFPPSTFAWRAFLSPLPRPLPAGFCMILYYSGQFLRARSADQRDNSGGIQFISRGGRDGGGRRGGDCPRALLTSFYDCNRN